MNSVWGIFSTVIIVVLTVALVYFSLVGAGRLFLFIRFRDKDQRAEALRKDHKGSYLNAARDHFTAFSYLIVLLIFLLFLLLKGINALLG